MQHDAEPHPLRHPVAWARAHTFAADVALALVMGGVVLAGLQAATDVGGTSERQPDLFAVVLIVAGYAAVAFRRRNPTAAVTVGTLLTVTYWILDYPDSGMGLAPLVLLYALAAHSERSRAIKFGLCNGAVLFVVLLVGFFADEENLPFVAVVANVVIFITAWTFGDSVRNRRAYLTEVEARADRAERDREAAAERAVEQERARIARELHDVVAHSVSVMTVQAGAARRVLARSPEQATESLGIIEATGRTALDELRRLLGVLRGATSDTASTAPQPTEADLDRLVASFRDSGLDVALQLDAADDAATLPAGVGLTVYRIVQEALTNVLKHAGPATTSVHVRLRDDTVTVQVLDDGRGPGPVGEHLPSAGQGLIGMRERVELFGGTLTTGPRPGGGHIVRAELPLERVVDAGARS